MVTRGLVGRTGRVAVLAGALVLTGILAIPAAHAENAAAQDLQDEAAAAVDGWLSALMGGDPVRAAAVLAPEFQIQREDGSGYDRDSYLAGGLPNLGEKPQVVDLIATGHGDMLVVRYSLTVSSDTTIEGRAVEPTAQRMTVFRREGDTWLVVAHANFAAPEAD